MRRILIALTLTASLVLGAGLTLAAQQSNVTNAVVIAALQAMGLFGDGYADGEVPVWTAAAQQFQPGAGGGGAPDDATYITQTPNAGLSAEQALSTLATGLMRSTTATGVVNTITSSTVGNVLTVTGADTFAFGTLTGASYPAACAGLTGVAVTATPSLLGCVNGTAVSTLTAALAATTVPLGVGINPPLEQFHAFASGTVGVFASWAADESLMFAGDTGSGPYVVSHTRSNGNSFGNTPAVRLNFGAGGFVVRTSPATAVGAARTFTTYATIGINGGLTLPKPGLGTTSTDGGVLENTTAATGGVPVQISPRLRLSGTTWDSDDSVSRTVQSILEVLGVSGATVSSLTRLGVIDPIAGTTTYPMQWTAAQARLLDGSNSVPSIGFNSETNTGMYLAGGGELGWTTLGTTQMRLGGSYLWAIPTKFLLGSANRFRLVNVGAELLNLLNDGETSGVGLSFANDQLLLIRNRAQSAAGGLGFDRMAVSATDASAPVACTSPAISWHNATLIFQVDVGTSCTGVSTLAVTLPAATNGWNCYAVNVTTAARDVVATAWTTTSVTVTNFARTTGLATDWADGDDVRLTCVAG